MHFVSLSWRKVSWWFIRIETAPTAFLRAKISLSAGRHFWLGFATGSQDLPLLSACDYILILQVMNIYVPVRKINSTSRVSWHRNEEPIIPVACQPLLQSSRIAIHKQMGYQATRHFIDEHWQLIKKCRYQIFWSSVQHWTALNKSIQTWAIDPPLFRPCGHYWLITPVKD